MRSLPFSVPQTLWTRIAAAVLALVVLAGLVVVGVRHFTGLPEDAAFSYGGKVVTQDDLAGRADLLGALYGVKQPTRKAERETFQRDVSKAVAVSMILDRAADERDISISDKSARDTLASMLKAQLGADPDAAFTAILGEFGVSENDVLDELKRQQKIARLFQDVTAKAVAAATPSAVKASFDKDPAQFAVPERRRLSNVVVATRKQAAAVLARARKGESFSRLARQTSLDDATRDKGGALGTVSENQLDPTFAKAAFAASDGGLFGPVKSQFGWNVGRVGRIVPGRPVAFATVKDDVADALRSELALAAWRRWLGDEIKDAHVDYAADYRPDHPDAAPSDSGVVPNPAVPSAGVSSTPSVP
ncbi:MAG: Peptidylprolyl isomerase [Aeromicrobium sp.]|jgi:peptidyl-prolyl cis-trans isomerase C|nr:Peptidylprolyl isomerase [Aeromicrobium sp.]